MRMKELEEKKEANLARKAEEEKVKNEMKKKRGQSWGSNPRPPTRERGVLPSTPHWMLRVMEALTKITTPAALPHTSRCLGRRQARSQSSSNYRARAEIQCIGQCQWCTR